MINGNKKISEINPDKLQSSPVSKQNSKVH